MGRPAAPRCILCVDPGTTESGYAYFWSQSEMSSRHGKTANSGLRALVGAKDFDLLLVEDITPFGRIGKTTVDTIKMIGRLQQIADDLGVRCTTMKRQRVKTILFGRSRGIKDNHVRAFLINYFDGEDQSRPITRTFSKDAWSALALGVAFKHNGYAP